MWIFVLMIIQLTSWRIPFGVSLAAVLRIPVSIHNLSDHQLFRPSAWSAFGALDPQGADYRACAAFGPLYSRK
jgi:hypothetical protein